MDTAQTPGDADPTRYEPPRYPQAPYPQTGYPQAPYPQTGYPQTGYPQTGYPQTGHPQVGYQPLTAAQLDAYPPPTTPHPGATPPTVGRRHRARLAMSLVAAGAVIAGASAWTAILVDGHDTTPAAAAASPGHTAARSHGVAGTVTAENGQTWTVRSAKGKVYTVTIGQQTKFGSAAKPAQQTAIATGAKVRVTGQASGASITATRVIPSAPSGTTGSTGSGATTS